MQYPLTSNNQLLHYTSANFQTRHTCALEVACRCGGLYHNNLMSNHIHSHATQEKTPSSSIWLSSCSSKGESVHTPAVTPAVQLLQIQEVHPEPHSNACNFFAIFIYFFIPVLSRPSFTSRTPNKDQKIEQLLYFLLVQVL